MIVNHLWQSTACVVLAWMLTLALCKNRAAVRYGIWLAASLKFLIPFSLLATAGSHLGWRPVPAMTQAQFTVVMEEIGHPFEWPRDTPQPAPTSLRPVLAGVWLCGFGISLGAWLRTWRRMRAIRRAATPLHWNLPIQAMSSTSGMEPGVFGIVTPVLLLPDGIAEHLTAPQLEAIVAHELCHMRRRDNLTGAIHMLVESAVWFHPLVRWIGRRLVEERERACDEAVLRLGLDAQTYAEGILQTCRYYLESPLTCVSGITGPNLKKRIEAIVEQRTGSALGVGKLLLASTGFAIVAARSGLEF